MNIGGLNPLSMIDFPGTPSAVVFTNGCQLECPYCHNSSLAKGISPQIPEQEVKEFLKSRVGKLQGVVISGGEPTLQPDLLDFCKFCKNLGYKVKVDTNGGRNYVVNDLSHSGYVDYIAMDIKHLFFAPPKKMCIGINTMWLSITAIRYGDTKGELRATCVHPFIDELSLEPLLEKLYYDNVEDDDFTVYLQHCNVTPEILNPEFFESGKGKPWTQEEIYNFVEKYGKQYNVKAR